MSILKTGMVAFGLVLGTAAMAQGRGDGKTPQERAQFRTDWMAKELSLSETQKTKVAALNLQMVEKNQQIKNDASLNEEQRKTAWKENRMAQKKQLKEILTADQLATLKEKKKEKGAKTRQKRANHDAKSPEQKAQMRTEHMTKELELTEDQSAKVKELNLAGIKKNEEVRTNENLTPEQKQEALKLNRKETNSKINEVLTPDQSAKMKAKREAARKQHPTFERAKPTKTK